MQTAIPRNISRVIGESGMHSCTTTNCNIRNRFSAGLGWQWRQTTKTNLGTSLQWVLLLSVSARTNGPSSSHELQPMAGTSQEPCRARKASPSPGRQSQRDAELFPLSMPAWTSESRPWCPAISQLAACSPQSPAVQISFSGPCGFRASPGNPTSSGWRENFKYFPSSSYQETMCQTRWN